MIAPNAALSARCYCGAVMLRSQVAAQSVVHCHCGQCRRLGGAAFTTWVSVRKSGVQVSGGEHLASFGATAHVLRHFCKTCGTHVFTADSRNPKILGVPAGIIDAPFQPEPTAHYFVSHQAAWCAISDELPRFGGESGFEPVDG